LSSTPERFNLATHAPNSIFPPLPPGSFPVSNCMLGQHCFTSTQLLRDRCPGCGDLLHVDGSCLLDTMEGSLGERSNEVFVSHVTQKQMALHTPFQKVSSSSKEEGSNTDNEEEEDKNHFRGTTFPLVPLFWEVNA